MKRVVVAVLSVVLAGGCSLIVEDQLGKAAGDAGPTGEVCSTTAQCLQFGGQQFNCRRVCRIPDGASEGRCVQLSAPMATPDGTRCGAAEGAMEICVAGECVQRGCGDGFADRLPDRPRAEFCDDGANGNPADGCNDECTRECRPGIPPCDDDEPCNGQESCVEGLCGASSGLTDGTPCTTSTIEAGTCVEQRCVADP